MQNLRDVFEEITDELSAKTSESLVSASVSLILRFLFFRQDLCTSLVPALALALVPVPVPVPVPESGTFSGTGTHTATKGLQLWMRPCRVVRG